MMDDMTANDLTPYIDDPQDCLDFGTVKFDLSEVVRQGGKRAVIGECVATGREFEAVYLHRDPMKKDRDIDTDTPMYHYNLDRIWQIDPEKQDVRAVGNYRALREMSVSYGAEGETLGPFDPLQAPRVEDLADRIDTRSEA